MKRAYPKLCHEKRRKRNNNPGTNGLRLVLSFHAHFFLCPGRMVGTGFFSIEKRESFPFFFKNLSSKCLSQMNTFFKHRVIILNRGIMTRNRTGGIARGELRGENPSLLRENYVFCVPREWYCSVSYLSFVNGKSLWAELYAGKSSLWWKANMLPLFSIMIYDSVFSSYTHLLCPKRAILFLFKSSSVGNMKTAPIS